MEISADKLSNESRKKLFQSPLPQNGISGFVAWSTGTVPLCSERGASSAAASSSEPCGACRGIDATTIVLARVGKRSRTLDCWIVALGQASFLRANCV